MPYDASDIKVLKSRDAVLRRPGMYFGNPEEAVNNAVDEFIGNAIDLHLAGLATHVKIEVQGRAIIITDDGPGFPFSIDRDDNPVERFLTRHHNSPTADGHQPHIHLGNGGLGLAFLNDASEQLTIDCGDGTWRWRQEFGKGEVLGPPQRVSKQGDTYTRLTFVPDPEVFGTETLDLSELRKILFEAAHLYPGMLFEMPGERFRSDAGLLDLAKLTFAGQSPSRPVRAFFLRHRSRQHPNQRRRHRRCG